jgi:hypothetical protein
MQPQIRRNENETVLPATVKNAVSSGGNQSHEHNLAESLELGLEDLHFDKSAETVDLPSPDVTALREVFLSRFEISPRGATTVAFTSQPEVSPLEMIIDGLQALPDVQLIEPELLEAWIRDPRFSQPDTKCEEIVIDGSVKYTENLDLRGQLSLLEVDGKQIARTEDFARAFIAFFVSTGRPFFGEGEDFLIQGTPYVRTDSGLFRYSCGQGLQQVVDHTDIPSPVVRVAGRVGT